LFGLFLQVLIDVWYPQSISLQLHDHLLNKVLPINADTSVLAPSCTDQYQSTRIRALATWTNGGLAGEDTITDADVTQYLQFSSNDTAVAMVLGSVVKGMGPGAAAITASGIPAAVPAAVVSVSQQSVCLLAVDALATTGVRLVASAPGSATAFSPGQPLLGSSPVLFWQAAQDLAWEDSSALIVSYASFSDGHFMDVSGRSSVSARVPAAVSGRLPFYLTTDPALNLPSLTINTTVSSSQASYVSSICMAFVHAS
jgi:hypothetical protein